MASVTALTGPVSVLTSDGVAVVLRPGDTLDEERLADHVREALGDPESYTSSKLGRVNGKGKPKAEKPEAPAGEPGTDQEGQAPGEPGDAETAEGGQPDAEPKDAAPAPRRRSRQA